MVPDTHAPAAPVEARCPHCRGAVRPGAPWCTQCWADLRPAPAPAAVLEPVVLPAVELPAAAALTPTTDAAPSSPPATKGWPCSGCGATNAVELDACGACGTGFLSGLRHDQPPLLSLPVVGDVTRLSRAQRLGLAAGLVLVVALLTALLALLTG